MTPFTPEQTQTLLAWAKRFPYPGMGLLEALRQAQEWRRCVTSEDEALLAGLFQTTPRRIHEIVTFYPYFTTRPAGKYRIEVCRNLSCHLKGSPQALKHLEDRLGIGEGRTTRDGLFSLEAVECLGACDFGPALSVNDELVGAATDEEIDSILDACRQGRAPTLPPLPALSGAGGKQPRVLTGHLDDPHLHRIEAYRRHGGYKGLEKARGMAGAAITEEIKRANLRGMGGAGFPTALKWETLPPKNVRDEPHYLVANADESEPGCFKDRVLLERNPHALIEGLQIAAKALDADGVYVFIRGEYARARRILSAAIAEARSAGYLDRDILVTRGANTYISGCDTALLEAMEGKKSWPRQPPPFPTVVGVMGHPTCVNNVETLMMAAAVLAQGGEWFAKLGVGKSGGTAVYSVSGHVQRPGIYEFPMGAPLKDILDAAGGPRPGRELKAVIPGGTSTPVLTAAEALSAKMDFDGLRAFGTFLGAGGLIVLDDTADMPEVLRIIERFLRHESCGQCTPCREGSWWVLGILERLLAGQGSPDDLDNLVRISDNISGKVICALGETIGPVCKAMLAKFHPDFEKRLR